MREEINIELGKLIGLTFQYAGRASNLFWLGFGDMIFITRRNGKEEEVAEYALHIQCAWRISKDKKILVASRDFYYPRSDLEIEDEDFDWDVQGDNRFDEKIKDLMENRKGLLLVENVVSDHLGSLTLSLSEGYILEVFPDHSEDDEYSEFWRFFCMKEGSPHFVVSGSGIEK